MLGGLQSTVAPPIFALRIITRPDVDVTERGRIKIVLIARVSAEDEAACRQRALNLWQTLHSMLPLSQDNIFMFEPVSSAFELDTLLEPFPIAGLAQLARRESSPSQAGDRYAVYPFLASR